MEINGNLQIKGTFPFKGAMVAKSSAQAISNNSNTALIWQTETYDVGGWFANSGDSHFTVPADVSYIKVYVQVTFAVDGIGRRAIKFFKNSSTFAGAGNVRQSNPDGSISDIYQAVTPAFAVSEGDILEAIAFQNSGGDLDVSSGATTWFAIEAVG